MTMVATSNAVGASPFSAANEAQRYNFNSIPANSTETGSRRRAVACGCSLFYAVAFVTILTVVCLTIGASVLVVINTVILPKFSVSSFQFDSTALSRRLDHSKFNFTVTARNPNAKITFSYDPVVYSIITSDGIEVGNGTFPAFIHGAKNTTALRTVVLSRSQSLSSATATAILNSDVNNPTSLAWKVQLDTNTEAKIGHIKTNKVLLRVVCNEIQASVFARKSRTDCRWVWMRFKIWKITIF